MAVGRITITPSSAIASTMTNVVTAANNASDAIAEINDKLRECENSDLTFQAQVNALADMIDDQATSIADLQSALLAQTSQLAVMRNQVMYPPMPPSPSTGCAAGRCVISMPLFPAQVQSVYVPFRQGVPVMVYSATATLFGAAQFIQDVEILGITNQSSSSVEVLVRNNTISEIRPGNLTINVTAIW